MVRGCGAASSGPLRCAVQWALLRRQLQDCLQRPAGMQQKRKPRRTPLPAACAAPSLNKPCRASWGEPYGGDCDDTFQLSPDGNTLTQHTDMVQRSTGLRTQYK